MRNKYYKYSVVILFIFTFLIFYYGLKEKNFYTPENISTKRFPNLFLNDFYTTNETSFEDILIDKKQKTAENMYNLGICYEALGDSQIARQYYIEALAIDEGNVNAIETLGAIENQSR